MSRVYEKAINVCRECPHSTNSAAAHDDPFSSTPYPINWWCTATKERDNSIVPRDPPPYWCPLPNRAETGASQ